MTAADLGASPIAITGATVIDGNGGTPVPNATVLVEGARITRVGAGDAVQIPTGATHIDGRGKFLLPGFIDTNVHLALHGNAEALIRYYDRYADIALESAQILLRNGITTVLDSYGPLQPLLAVRDAIARGDVPGPRVYVAGNIVGWGGPGSLTFGSPGSFAFDWEMFGLASKDLTYLIEQIQDLFTEGTGEELIAMEPEELRQAMNAYLDKGVDFVKYGGTTHAAWPAMILFSKEAQEVIVEETHRRGKTVQTHSTSPEGVRLALEAGIDLVQHPECLDVPMSDQVAELHAAHNVICSMHTGIYTGKAWEIYQKRLEEDEKETAPASKRAPTGMERRRKLIRHNFGWFRENARKLARTGCTLTAASDACSLRVPELTRDIDEDPWWPLPPGIGTLAVVEGLVDIGLTPMQALTAATRNGALAARALDEYGTIEVGKSADLVLLDADPLADIHNIRKQSMVMARGRIVDTAALPQTPVLYRARAEQAREEASQPLAQPALR
jgi:imidazolonepropionase-like amidohydrolase